MKLEKVNLTEKFSRFHEHWQPKIAGELNDSYVKLVKFQGEFVWHHHEHEDELFLVVKGAITMRLRTGDVRTSTVPTVQQKLGVFSSPIFDPSTPRRDPFPSADRLQCSNTPRCRDQCARRLCRQRTDRAVAARRLMELARGQCGLV